MVDSGVLFWNPRVMTMLFTQFVAARDTERNVASGASSRVCHVIIDDIRLLEEQQGPLEIVQDVLLGTGVADILEEIHVRLVGAPELLVQGMDLADLA